MRLIDLGQGVPLIIVPGVQGRWEWMMPAVERLARECRVITFSLADEPTCGAPFDERNGFSCYVDQIALAMDAARLSEASICGVSYGGLIAAAFAARYPERVSSLMLVSAPPPSWKPTRRVTFYLSSPRLLAPVFMVASLRMYREMAAAAGGVLAAAGPSLRHAGRVLTHMFSPVRMARRVRLLAGLHIEADLARVAVPTLIITGEPNLDRIVPVDATRSYATVWPHAHMATIERTGHLGLITRPEEFAGIVVPFVKAAGSRVARQRVRSAAPALHSNGASAEAMGVG